MKFRRRLLAIASSALLFVGFTAVAVTVEAQPAAASASGVQYWGPINIAGHSIPTGQYSVSVVGSGSYTNYVVGQFYTAGTVCNWNITAEFFDNNSNWIRTFSGAQHWSCSPTGEDVVGTWYWLPSGAGFVCSTLKSNGVRITSWCASIHP